METKEESTERAKTNSAPNDEQNLSEEKKEESSDEKQYDSLDKEEETLLKKSSKRRDGLVYFENNNDEKEEDKTNISETEKKPLKKNTLEKKPSLKKSPSRSQILVRQITKELKPNKDLLPLKVVCFFVFGGLYSVTPFFTLHMQQLGISVEEIAVITSLLPLAAIFGPLISGLIADYTSNFKGVLTGNLVLTIVFGIVITKTPTSFVPPSIKVVPDSFHFHDVDQLQVMPCHMEDTMAQYTCQFECIEESVRMKYNSTTVMCQERLYEHANVNEICFLKPLENENCIRISDGAENDDKILTRFKRNVINIQLGESALQNTDDHVHNSHGHAHKSDDLVHNSDDNAHTSDDHPHKSDDNVHNTDDHVNNSDDHAQKADDNVQSSHDHAHNTNHVHNSDDHQEKPSKMIVKKHVTTNLMKTSKYKPIEKYVSQPHVELKISSKDSNLPKFCSADCHQSKDDTLDQSIPTGFSGSRTFWIYFLLRFLMTLFMNSSFCLMDASTMAVIGKLGGDYGKQRLVAMVALATMPFVSSVIIQGMNETNGFADYAIPYYMMSLMVVIGIIVMYCTRIEMSVEDTDQSYKEVMAGLKTLLKRSKIIIFLIVLLFLGMEWGFLESYLFVFLNHLKAPTYMLGLTMTFGCVTGIPMLLVSDRLVNYMGRDRVFFYGFLAYTVRMFGYSFITNPWYCFIFEALEVFTYQLMWVAAVTMFPILAPQSLLATLTGLSGAVHYNIGKGVGTFVGGFLFAFIGMVWTFRAFGIVSFIFAFGYYFVQKKIRLDSPSIKTEKKDYEEKAEVLEKV